MSDAVAPLLSFAPRPTFSDRPIAAEKHPIAVASVLAEHVGLSSSAAGRIVDAASRVVATGVFVPIAKRMKRALVRVSAVGLIANRLLADDESPPTMRDLVPTLEGEAGK